MTTSDYQQRFGSIERLYGAAAIDVIKNMHVCVVGLGGVGSWAAEALARTGIGKLTIIDFDDIQLSNVNRQLHTLTETVGEKKFKVIADRIQQINPHCDCQTIDDFLTLNTLDQYLALSRGYDYVIDAIDSIKFKSAMINHCKRNKIPLITTGGAGGLSDPTMIKVTDISRTYNDPLAAKVRSQLRREYGFPTKAKRNFGIECVFSTQQPVYPKEDGTVSHKKPGIHGVSLDCRFGYGSVTYVTAAFGLVAASRAINKMIKNKHTG